MATVRKSARYRGTEADYQQISEFLASCSWDRTIHTIYVTNGWHSGYETRMAHLGGGRMEQRLMEVWYFDYCVNNDGSAIFHYYAN